MAIREGRWDCTTCGTKGVRGSSLKCPNCGSSRPADVKFYLPEDAPEVTDAEQIKHAQAGADWYCEHCGSGNSNARVDCRQCGAPKGSSPAHEQKTYAPEEVPTYGNIVPDEVLAAQAMQRVAPKPKSKAPMFALVGIPFAVICLVLTCVVGGMFMLLRTTDESLTVQGFSWSRTVAIEEIKTVREQDWAVPTGGREVSSRQEIHHYDKVIDRYETKTRQVSERVKDGEEKYVCGKKDLGNGHFEDKYCTRDKYRTEYRTETYQDPVYKDVPRYQTKYTYDIEKWLVNRTEEAAGEDHNAQWPSYELKSTEREGEKKETYTIRFLNSKGKEYSLDFPFEKWRTYETNQKVTAKVDIFGEVVEVDGFKTKSASK